MANSRSSGEFYKYATVDTNPGAEGYWTEEISIRFLKKKLKVEKVFFSIREFEADSSEASDTSDVTVRLQFKCPGDAGWQDLYRNSGSGNLVGERIAIEDTAANVLWRAGVKDGDYVSGKVTFGFDW